MHYHNPKLTQVANEMRHKPTSAERKLWYALLKDYTPKFQRQKSVLRFVADFYCASAKLVIEIDGGYHSEIEQAERDAARTELMEKLEITVVRFTNEDIETRLPYVASVITKVLSAKRGVSRPSCSIRQCFALPPSSWNEEGHLRWASPRNPGAAARGVSRPSSFHEEGGPRSGG